MKCNKKTLILIFLIIILFAFISIALLFINKQPKSGVVKPKSESKEEVVANAPTLASTPESVKDLARQAVETSATYAFDGSGLEFESSLPLSCADCWELVFSFESSAGGYGDRTGSILTQAVTPHEIKVFIENGKVVAMITDAKYDEIKQEFLGQPN